MFLKRTLLLLVILLLAACSTEEPAPTAAPDEPTTAAENSADPTEEPEEPASALSGEISIYPQNYYNPDANPEGAAVVEALVAEYEALHPDVSVDLIPYVGDSNEYRTWLLTRLSANQAPNITWEQYSDRNREGDEVWVDLTDYFEMPNPYVPAGQPGSERWGDLFPDYVLAQTQSRDGRWYQVNLDWVETGLYYNQELFDEMGISADWSSYTDFLGDCETLKATGVDPVGVFMTPEWSTYQWMDDVLISSAYSDIGTEWYLDTYNIDGRDFRRLNPEEFAKAVYEGAFTVDDERFDTYLSLTQQFAESCLMEGFAGGVNYDEMIRLFVEGEVAMAWLGAWSAQQLQEDVNFDFGLTYLPPITADQNPRAIHTDASYRVGGPSGSAQYGITQATAEAGLLEEALDLLMFWTAPQNFQKVYDTFPNNVPVVAGMSPSEVGQQFQFVAANPERLLGDPIARLTPQFGTEHNRLFQQFMLGEISADELKEQYQPLLTQGAEDLCRESEEWEWCDS